MYTLQKLTDITQKHQRRNLIQLNRAVDISWQYRQECAYCVTAAKITTAKDKTVEQHKIDNCQIMKPSTDTEKITPNYSTVNIWLQLQWQKELDNVDNGGLQHINAQIIFNYNENAKRWMNGQFQLVATIIS